MIAISGADAGTTSKVDSHVTMANVTYASVDTPKGLVAWVHGRQPTGTVQFTVNGVKACTAKVETRRGASVGRASCRATFQKPGTFGLRAAYFGDAHNRPAAVTGRLRVVKHGSSVFAGVRDPEVNARTSLTAVVRPGDWLTGTVTFFVNGARTCAARVTYPNHTVPRPGSASCPATFRKLGRYTLRAVYSGDARFKPSSVTQYIRISKDATRTTNSGSPRLTQIGAPARLSAQVLTYAIAPQATGTVKFELGGKTLCAAVVKHTSTTASANCTWTPTSLGGVTLTAVYSGDATHARSHSAPFNVAVGKDLSTLTGTATPVSAGGTTTVTVKATSVYGGTPTGTVQFFLEGAGVPYPLLCTVTLSGGTGSCPATMAAPGSYKISAIYSGDSRNQPAVANIPLTVSRDATATSVRLPAVVSSSAGSVTLAATVTAPYETPSGSVAFSENGVTLCTTPLSGGTGSCLAPIPPNSNGGNRQVFTITATYSGDAYDSSSAGTASLTVNY